MADFITATDNDYDSQSRNIEFKAAIYLFGDLREPLIIDRDNFLIDFSLLEETNSEDKSPFGNVTANEISLRLMNIDSIFSPTNTSSQYYGYMKRGVRIAVFMRPAARGDVEYNWDSLGEFYITDWEATITSVTATITASDKLYSIFEQPPIKLPILRNVSFASFFSYVFSVLGVYADVDSTLVRNIAIAYSTDTNKDLLAKTSVGALANCFCDHSGNITVRSITSARPLRATLTDADQIIDASSSQSSDTNYTGASVTYNTPTESEQVELLKVPEFIVPAGTTTHNPIAISNIPMVRLIYGSLIGTSDAYVESIESTSLDVKVTTRSMLNTESQVSLSIFGTHIVNTATSVSDNGQSDLVIDNMYIQTNDYAEHYKRVLQRYISSDMPVVTVQIRGNPLLNLGDKIRIISDKNKLDFTGILLRNELIYNGALSATITLLSDTILEGSQ